MSGQQRPVPAGQVALVTGGSRGIGAEIARRLARDGFSVVINYSTGAGLAETVLRDIEAAGGRAMMAQADVSDPAAVQRMYDTAAAELGGLDVLVNNAGIQLLAPLGEMEDDAFDRLVEINLKGVFYNLREAARRMRDGGRIINMSSGTTSVLPPGYGVYAATKAAVQAMSGVMAKEMRGRGITVNAVVPGPVATDLYLTGKSAQVLEEQAKRSPLGRLGQPADIAGAVSFLAGPDGAWINGQSFPVNGGFA